MKKLFITALFIFHGLLLISNGVAATESAVPEPFQGFDSTSTYTIRYDDLTALFKTVVVDVGRSTREVAAPAQAKTGTRMKPKVKRLTSSEANRFYYETFEDNEAGRELLAGIRDSLALVPTDAPLKYFSRDEQLAYWLNLYNVTLLNEIVAIYPQRDLKKLFKRKSSILDKKLLTVAGIPLSLNDIQFTILKNNYNNDPLIMYGLYQGYIGAPNIRRSAFTGSDVYRALENNAIEFINSNRGTFSKDDRTFRVSSLYDRNSVYFPDFNADITKHLMAYLEDYERDGLQTASVIKADINDWTVTDLGGTYQEIGGSFASNNAALLDSVKSTTINTNQGAGGASLGASVGHGASSMASKGNPLSRFDPEFLEKMHEINEQRLLQNEKNATVTIEELGEFPVEPDPEKTPDKDGNN